MNFENKLISGQLIKRYKRFFVDIKINNQIISNTTTPITFGRNNDQEDDLFEAFNLARHTV